MFTALRHPVLRLFPAAWISTRLHRKPPMPRNTLYPEEMTEGLMRDLGLLDGRTRRGVSGDRDLQAAIDLIQARRAL
jgi:hypothetical protein